MNDWIASLKAAWNKLAARERLFVAVAGGLLFLGFIYLVVLSPILGAAGRTEQRLLTADQQLQLMQRLRREYDEVNVRLVDVEQRIRNSPRGNLRSTLESLASQAGVKVESMEPQASPANETYQETKVEVGLRGVTLVQTVQYLHQIESSPQVLSVKSLRVRARPDKPELLDVTFTVSSFEPI